MSARGGAAAVLPWVMDLTAQQQRDLLEDVASAAVALVPPVDAFAALEKALVKWRGAAKENQLLEQRHQLLDEAEPPLAPALHELPVPPVTAVAT